MFHRFFTTQQLSKYFKVSSALTIICLLAALLQNYYVPHREILEQIIEFFSQASLFVTALIVISQMLLIFTKNHRDLIIRYKLLAIIIELLLSFSVFLLLAMTHHIKVSFIKFYSSESVAPAHSIKIIYLLLFIVIMLIIDLYISIKKIMKNSMMNPSKKLYQKKSVYSFTNIS